MCRLQGYGPAGLGGVGVQTSNKSTAVALCSGFLIKHLLTKELDSFDPGDWGRRCAGVWTVRGRVGGGARRKGATNL